MTQGDSAGAPWAGRAFVPTGFEDDGGEAPPALADAVAAYAGTRRGLAGVVEALSVSRLLVPVVATLADSEQERTTGLVVDKAAEMAAVTLRGKDGRIGLPVFSSARALTTWDASARPVPVEARRAALAAVEEGADVLVLDVAGPVPVVVPRPALWALAQGRRWVPSPQDALVLDAVAACLRDEPDVVEVRCAPGRQAELCVVLAVRPGLDRAGLDVLTAGASRRLSADPTVAERVESLELRITTARG